MICPANHPHGEKLTCFVRHRCRCAACCAAKSRYAAAIAKRHADRAATPIFVPSSESSAHLRSLVTQGASLRRIASRSGLSVGSVQRILRHASSKVRWATAKAILSVEMDGELIADRTMVPSVGVRRRIEALQLDGWPLRVIAAAAAMTTDGLRRAATAPTISMGTLRKVDAVYLAPASTIGVHAQQVTAAERVRIKALARQRGYVPALAWDDIDRDTAPAVQASDSDVDDVAVALALAGVPVLLRGAERAVVRRRGGRQAPAA